MLNTSVFLYKPNSFFGQEGKKAEPTYSPHSLPPKKRTPHSCSLLGKGSRPGTVLFPEPCLVIVQKKFISTQWTHPTECPMGYGGTVAGSGPCPGSGVASKGLCKHNTFLLVPLRVDMWSRALHHCSSAQSPTEKDALFNVVASIPEPTPSYLEPAGMWLSYSSTDYNGVQRRQICVKSLCTSGSYYW